MIEYAAFAVLFKCIGLATKWSRILSLGGYDKILKFNSLSCQSNIETGVRIYDKYIPIKVLAFFSKYLIFALTSSYLYRIVNVASIRHCKLVRIKVMCVYWRIKNLRVIILWKLSISDSYLFKRTFINIPIYAYLIRAKVSWIQYARIEFIVRVYLITHVQIIALFNFKFQIIYKICENRNFILL